MAKIEELRKYSGRRDTTVYSVFRQLVANGGIKFSFAGVSVELQERDLQRVHDIINEIDERRAFYNDIEDEIPKNFVASVLEAKKVINELRRGLWANAWSREIIARLLHELGEFLTRTEGDKLPKSHHDKGFPDFEDAALELRLKVWTLIGHLTVVFGEQVQAFHAPQEILRDVRVEYERGASRT